MRRLARRLRQEEVDRRRRSRRGRARRSRSCADRPARRRRRSRSTWAPFGLRRAARRRASRSPRGSLPGRRPWTRQDGRSKGGAPSAPRRRSPSASRPAFTSVTSRGRVALDRPGYTALRDRRSVGGRVLRRRPASCSWSPAPGSRARSPSAVSLFRRTSTALRPLDPQAAGRARARAATPPRPPEKPWISCARASSEAATIAPGPGLTSRIAAVAPGRIRGDIPPEAG